MEKVSRGKRGWGGAPHSYGMWPCNTKRVGAYKDRAERQSKKKDTEHRRIKAGEKRTIQGHTL